MNPRYIMPLLVMMIFAISACGIEQTTNAITDTPEVTLVPTVTQTSPPPTSTPIPMVVIINGQGITFEEYEAELNRYLTALESDTLVDPFDAETIVLEDLISQTLLMQGADENGFDLSDDDLETRLEELILEAGGEAEFNQWLELSGYDLESLKLSLARSIKAAWMRDQILAGVPRISPHVNLRQIFFLDSGQADQVLRELESGRDFATTAAEIDPLTGGELGWVPRNFLLHKEIEEAAFALLPGEISQVIETSVGYHIIQVVAIEDERRLSPAARLIWQELALRDWVDLRREVSNIEKINVE
ncbi:MAG: peptidylprolyl isomerase [Anaerolineales bacterium]|nr:peptidylprolyl isomerase [Anaerolineales bacterium]